MTMRRAARHERGELRANKRLITDAAAANRRSRQRYEELTDLVFIATSSALIHFHFIDHHFFPPTAAGGSCWTEKPAGGLLIHTEPEGNTRRYI